MSPATTSSSPRQRCSERTPPVGSPGDSVRRNCRWSPVGWNSGAGGQPEWCRLPAGTHLRLYATSWFCSGISGSSGLSRCALAARYASLAAWRARSPWARSSAKAARSAALAALRARRSANRPRSFVVMASTVSDSPDNPATSDATLWTENSVDPCGWLWFDAKGGESRVHQPDHVFPPSGVEHVSPLKD